MVCSLSGGTLAGMPSWCSKDPVTPETSLVKGEWQRQEENQADPSLMQQPLEIGGKCEVLGDHMKPWQLTETVCALLGQILMRTLRVPE